MSSKKLREIGEFKLIEKIKKMIPIGDKVDVGIGDDAAVLNLKDTKLLATCDMLVEDVHFLPSIAPEDLGWKALAVSLSDISAMGGIPLFSLLSLSLPPNTEENWIKRFIQGWEELSRMFSVYLVGGNISQGEKIVIDSIVLGEVKTPILRSNAQVGDKIYVTGFLGDSSAGLYCLQKEITNFPSLIRKHLRPLPRVNEGKELASTDFVHSMIDISDGLVGDLRHICEESGKGAIIFAEKIPLSPDLIAFCETFDFQPLEFALFGGEDYELLFTGDVNLTMGLDIPFTEIGKITEGRQIFLIKGTEEIELDRKGFEHFRQNL